MRADSTKNGDPKLSRVVIFLLWQISAASATKLEQAALSGRSGLVMDPGEASRSACTGNAVTSTGRPDTAVRNGGPPALWENEEQREHDTDTAVHGTARRHTAPQVSTDAAVRHSGLPAVRAKRRVEPVVVETAAGGHIAFSARPDAADHHGELPTAQQQKKKKRRVEPTVVQAEPTQLRASGASSDAGCSATDGAAAPVALMKLRADVARLCEFWPQLPHDAIAQALVGFRDTIACIEDQLVNTQDVERAICYVRIREQLECNALRTTEALAAGGHVAVRDGFVEYVVLPGLMQEISLEEVYMRRNSRKPFSQGRTWYGCTKCKYYTFEISRRDNHSLRCREAASIQAPSA